MLKVNFVFVLLILIKGSFFHIVIVSFLSHFKSVLKRQHFDTELD